MLKFVSPFVLLVLLSACSLTSDQEKPHGHHRPLPPPVREIGMVLHNLQFSTGFYALQVATHEGRKDQMPVDEQLKLPDGNVASVTWLGHSSSLIHIGGLNVLTDPVILDGSLDSPLPVRLIPPPLKVRELPQIDVILLSHGDYDHLNLPTMRALAKRFPGATILAPRAITAPLKPMGFTDIRELAAGQSGTLGGLTFLAQPAQHRTRRSLLGVKNGEALSWIVTDGQSRIIFIGDTGYSPVFSRIGERHGPFDAALIPIGAFEPRDLVNDMHATPEEAARIARDLKARIAIGIHWGTFAFSAESSDDAKSRFLAAGGQGSKTTVLRPGETLIVRRQ